jgi:hypothetical protein
MERLRSSFEEHLKAGARVVSHEHPIPLWTPDVIHTPQGRFNLENEPHTLYLYRR